MTRKKLESVYWLKKELKHWQQRYAEIQADIALSPKELDGMPYSKTNKVTNPTEIKGIELMEATKEINNRMVEISTALREIDKFILKISKNDSRLGFILWARCENLMEWQQIADELANAHDMKGYTADSLRQIYSRFVRTLPKE